MSPNKQTNVRSEMRAAREAEIRLKYKAKVESARKEIPKRVRMKDVRIEKNKAAELFGKELIGDDKHAFYESNLSSIFGAFAKVDKAASNINKMSDMLNDKIDDIVAAFKGAAEGLFWQVPLLVLAYCIADKMGVGLACLGILVPKLSAYLGGFWSQTQEGPQLQSGVDIASLITTLITMSILPGNASASSIADTILRRVGSFERSTEGFKALFNTLMEYAEKVINACLKYFSMDEISIMDTSHRCLKGWMLEVDKFEKICAQGNPSTTELRKAVDLQVKGIGFREVVKTPASIMMVNKYLERLGVLLQSRRGALTAANCFRQQTLFVLLGGGSGCGKTILQKYLAIAALIHAGEVDADEGLENLWQKGTTEYWNGYVGQKCVIVDDAFQIKKPDSMADSEYMQIIRTVGSWALPLNFADLESKGRFYFNSPMIMGSTNEDNVFQAAQNFVNCPDAVARRITFGYWIEIAPEFLDPETKRLDYVKWAKTLKNNLANKTSDQRYMDCLPWEAWRLYKHGFDGPYALSTHGPYVSPRDVAIDISKELIRRREAHDVDTQVSDEFFHGIQADMESDMRNFGVTYDTNIYETMSNHFKEHGITPPDNQDTTGVAMSLVKLLGVVSPVESEETEEMFEDCDDDVLCVDSRTGKHVRSLQMQPMPPTASRQEHSACFDDVYVEPDRPYAFELPQLPLAEPSELSFEDDCKNLREERSLFRDFALAVLRMGQKVVDKMKSMARDYLIPFAGKTVVYAVDALQGAIQNEGMDKIIPLLKLSGLLVVIAGAIKLLCNICGIVVGAFWDGIMAIKRFLGFENPDDDEIIVEDSNIKPDNSKGKTRIKFVKGTNLQDGDSGEQYDREAEIIDDGCYFIRLKAGNVHKDVGTVQFIEGNLSMMPSHFRRQMLDYPDQKATLEFTHCLQSRYNFTLPMSKFLSFKHLDHKASGLDLLFVSFDVRTLRAHRSITNKMFTEKLIEKFVRAGGKPCSGNFKRVRVDSKGTITIENKGSMSNTCKFITDLTVKDSKYLQVFEYEALSRSGDCGSPLVIQDNRNFGGATYLGMHFAGNRDVYKARAYAVIVTREMALQAQEHLRTYKDDVKEGLEKRGISLIEPTIDEQSALVGEGKLVDGSFLLIGKVDKPLNIGATTKLRLSPMGEDEVLGPQVKKPAILRPIVKDGVTVYPMIEGMKAYQSPHEWRDVPNLRLVVETVTKPFREASKDLPAFVMTIEEAATGIEGLSLKKIARDTSPGYPYRLESSNGKTKWFGTEDDYVLEGPAWESLKADVESMISDARQNRRPTVIYTDFLKDELRPLAKVDAVKTRCISGTPLDYLLAFRMYFGTFMSACLATRLDAWLAPGMNPMTEWHVLVRKLREKGSNMFAGDFSRFDASEQPYVHFEILEFVNRWYAKDPSWKPEDDQIRNMLWLDLVHSRHLTGLGNTLEYVVQWNKSLPSGHPMTTIVNSFYCLITLGACYVHLTGDVNDMLKNVFLCPYGDDNINSAADTVAKVFHQTSVSKAMKELFGLVYTSDKKDAELKEFEPLEDLTFLQRGFVEDMDGHGGILAPLGEGSFAQVPYWYRNKNAVVMDMMDNLQTSLGELSLHPREKWDATMEQLGPWLKKHDLGHHLTFTTYEGARQWRLTNVDKWI